MDPYAQKVEVDIQERISVLPEDITELYTLGIVDSVIEETKETYELSVTQARMLTVDIDLVLFLFYPRLGFTERIKESMELPDEKAESIANHIDAELFATVGYILDILDEDAAIAGGTDAAPAASSSETPEAETKNAPASPPKPSRPGIEPITPSDVQPRANQFDPEPVHPPAPHEVETSDVPDAALHNTPPRSTSAPAQTPTPTTPATASASASASAVQPIKTMEHDLDKIHGYGAYRKMYPDASNPNEASPKESGATTNPSDEVRTATSQEEVLNRQELSDAPSSMEEKPQ